LIRSRYNENLGRRDVTEEVSPISVVEDKCKDIIDAMFQRDAVKKVCGGKRTRAHINLSQAYTSGDIIKIAEETAREKDEASEAKRRKLEEKSKIREQKEREMEMKKIATAEKKKEAEKNKEAKEKMRKYTTCDTCKRRRTERTKDKGQWVQCNNCQAYGDLAEGLR
jgi:glucan-binding YG repeat protein